MVAARATRNASVKAAWTTYSKQVRQARITFRKATGHWPHGWVVVIPKSV